jgi:N-acetylmuramoyl-L-alanine amidase
MFDKLIEFFQSLFSGKGSNDDPNPTPTPTPTVPTEPDEEELVADGSDLLVDPDSIGTVVFPEELEILEPEIVTPTPVTPTPIETITDPTDGVVEVPDPVVVPVVEPEVPEVPKHNAKYLWCLDNGHGKFTAGKRSPKFEDGTKFYEYEFNRDIVKKVSEQLTAKGVQFFNVVPEVDTDNFLKGRVDRANAFQSDLPKLFVSIHSNAARAESSEHWAVPGAKGMETWYYTGSSRGRKLASIFQKHMVNYTGMVNRGLKSTKKLYVIKNTKMTAALTENGFYNHQGEAQELMKDEVRQSIADAHVAAIMEIEKDGL